MNRHENGAMRPAYFNSVKDILHENKAQALDGLRCSLEGEIFDLIWRVREDLI